MLITAKVPDSLGMRLGPKAWLSIYLEFEPRTFGAQVEVIA